jgi:hypothetical protein
LSTTSSFPPVVARPSRISSGSASIRTSAPKATFEELSRRNSRLQRFQVRTNAFPVGVWLLPSSAQVERVVDGDGCQAEQSDVDDNTHKTLQQLRSDDASGAFSCFGRCCCAPTLLQGWSVLRARLIKASHRSMQPWGPPTRWRRSTSASHQRRVRPRCVHHLSSDSHCSSSSRSGGSDTTTRTLASSSSPSDRLIPVSVGSLLVCLARSVVSDALCSEERKMMRPPLSVPFTRVFAPSPGPHHTTRT